MNILLAIFGIALVIWGANRMTDGAVGIAERMRIPQIVIGLTVVAVGTSAPELFVSLMSAIKGTPDLAVGNVVGSNIMNVLIIAGVTALVAPMTVERATVRRDLPIGVLAALTLAFISIDGDISRLDAALLFALFISYMCYTVVVAKRESKSAAEQESASAPAPIWKSILFVILGLACLVVGGDLFVDGASGVARDLGISDAIIGLTIVACGTSLPELATSIVAARKGNSGIAIGNVIGSNVFNILMILGITGLVSPMQISGISTVDMAVMAGSSFLMWLFCYTKLRMERWEGGVMVACYAAYLWWLFQNI